MVDSTPPQLATPPTEPDASRVLTPAPTSRLAMASLGTAAAGLVLPLFGIAAIVLGVLAVRRIPARGQEGRGLALAGIGIGFVGFLVTAVYGFMIVSLVSAIGQTQRMVLNTQQMTVRSQAVTHAQANQGRYPRHVAELAMSSSASFPVWAFSNNPSGPLVVGDVDLRTYSDSPEMREKLKAAIAATDLDAPCYELGDVWFVRLDGPTYDSDIVYSWTIDDASGIAFFVMDDGTLDVTNDLEAWTEQWETDAKARPRHKLPAIAMPPAPAGLGQ